MCCNEELEDDKVVKRVTDALLGRETRRIQLPHGAEYWHKDPDGMGGFMITNRNGTLHVHVDHPFHFTPEQILENFEAV